jgi:MFS family permease
MIVTPLLLQDVFSMSVTASSWVTLCRTGAGALGAFVAGWLASRLGGRRMAVLAGLAMVAGAGVIALGTHATTLALVMVGLLVSGAGSGAIQPAAAAFLANTVAPRDIGIAASMNQTMQSIGAVTGTSLFSAIATGTGGSRYVVVYVLAAVGAAICTAFASRLGVARRPARGRAAAPARLEAAAAPAPPER